MSRKLAVLTALLLLCATLVPATAETPRTLKVVATTFPLYDWTRQVIGPDASHVELSLVQDSGIDLHNFQPTVQDIVRVSSADVFIYLGGPSDGWVADALKEARQQDMHALNLMEALGDQVKQDVTVEGMQETPHHHDHDDHDHDHDHDHEHDADHDHEHDADHNHDHEHDADHAHEGEADHDHEHESDHAHEGEADHDHDHDHDHGHEGNHGEGRVHNHADEHIWLSLRNAQVLVKAIADTLSNADPANQQRYQDNAAQYNLKLQELDQRYAAAVSKVENPTLLYGDRFPFRYLMDDYGITYYAAFAGCSAETEASFQTIAFLADKADALKLKAVLTLDGSDGRIAEAVVRTSEDRQRPVLQLNAMQSLSREDLEAGATYLNIMEDNLKVIEQAL